MKVVIFGATGMVGRGTLRECLRDPQVEGILSVVRSPGGKQHEKLREVVHQNLLDFTAIENELAGLDACIYCIGVASTAMTEDAYARVTYESTTAAARTLLRLNPRMSFVFVSGAGADRTERGNMMWARIKGKTENALLAMPFRSVYVFRPAMIQPLDGIESKTPSYRIMYRLIAPFLSATRHFWPQYITTTQELGRALLAAAKQGTGTRVIEAPQIRAVLREFT